MNRLNGFCAGRRRFFWLKSIAAFAVALPRCAAQDRYACSAHVTNGSCANTRTIPRGDLDSGYLPGSRIG